MNILNITIYKNAVNLIYKEVKSRLRSDDVILKDILLSVNRRQRKKALEMVKEWKYKNLFTLVKAGIYTDILDKSDVKV